MGQRGFLAKTDVPQAIVVSEIPTVPDKIAKNPIALQHWEETISILSKLSLITESMIPQIATLCELEIIKQNALSEIEKLGYTIEDQRGRIASNPHIKVYMAAIREQRAIMRDLGLIAQPSGKEKPKSKFAIFLENSDE